MMMKHDSEFAKIEQYFTELDDMPNFNFLKLLNIFLTQLLENLINLSLFAIVCQSSSYHVLCINEETIISRMIDDKEMKLSWYKDIAWEWMNLLELLKPTNESILKINGNIYI